METQTLENPTFDTQDEFKRKPIAENIIRLLTSPIDLSPMVIDGGWGTGKTEFCQKLIRLMQQQHPDYQPVYIDAFRSDHSGERLCWHCLPKSLKPVRLKILASGRLNSAKK